MKNIKKLVQAKVSNRPARFYVLLLVLLFFLLAASSLYYRHSWQKQLPQKGTLAEDQQFQATPDTAYKNLDLKIASSYHFKSDKIKTVKDLGLYFGVNQSIISFRVPADNFTEFGLMTKPTTKKPANGYPVIILCHGYATPDVYSTELQYLSDMVEYSKAGFVVIKPDFRGQGLSLDVGEAEGAYYSMAYNTDVMSLLAAVKKTDYLDSANISLWGHSMGAYIALRAAVMSPGVKNLILLSGPVGKVEDMFQQYVAISDKDNPIAQNIRQAVLLRYGSPISNPEFYKTASPLNYLDQLKAKVQIHVGSLDRVVPPQFSADLDQALSEAHKQHGYYIYPLGQHGLIDERPQIYQRSLQLLKTN